MISRVDLLLSLSVAACLLPQTASGAPLRIRSATAISGATLLAPGDRVVLRGTLRDDLGEPVQGERVELSLDATPASVNPCSVRDDVGAEGRSLYARTAQDGSFCVSLYGILPRGKADVRFAGSEYHLPAVGEIPLEPAAGGVTLHFEGRDLVADLDQPSWLVPLMVRGTGDGAPASVRLSLLHQVGSQPARSLATLDARTGARVEIDVDTRALGEPGTGRLIARQTGATSTGQGEAVATLRTTARVQLTGPETTRPTPRREEVVIDVEARSSVGPVRSGWVQAESQDEVLGAAPVMDGLARVPVRVPAVRADSVAVRMRYAPENVGWLPGNSIWVTVPIAPPSPWSRLPWVLAALGVTYWVVRTWRRPARVEPKARGDRPQPLGRPGVVFHAPSGTVKGWRGHVVDAHTGEPVAGARLEITIPSFTGSGTRAVAVTELDGSFVFTPEETDAPEGSELRVIARWHGALTRPLPPRGRLTVSLVSRRRALLARLVAWAESRGSPWRGAGEPTPGEVETVARRRGDHRAAEWARSVEEAAFGEKAPDEAVETGILEREPGALSLQSRER